MSSCLRVDYAEQRHCHKQMHKRMHCTRPQTRKPRLTSSPSQTACIKSAGDQRLTAINPICSSVMYVSGIMEMHVLLHVHAVLCGAERHQHIHHGKCHCCASLKVVFM
jgi:hypothetical protein